MTTKTPDKTKKSSQSTKAIEVDKDVSGAPAPVVIPETVKQGKLSDLIDLSANAVESKYHHAFISIMKAGIDRMPELRAKDFKSPISVRLVVNSQPNRRQANIVSIGKPDIEHAHVLYLWVGHEDYALAVRNGEWTTVSAHISATGLELIYKANTLKARSSAETGGKLTPDFKRDLQAIGVEPESRVGHYRGTKGLEKWAQGEAIQEHLKTLASMYVPAYTAKSEVDAKKSTVILVCEPGCKLTDAAPYGIRVKRENVNDYLELLRCDYHDGQLSIKEQE
jgi:hypothetical protein